MMARARAETEAGGLSAHKNRFSPAGRPLDYQGGHGWSARITSRTLCADISQYMMYADSNAYSLDVVGSLLWFALFGETIVLAVIYAVHIRTTSHRVAAVSSMSPLKTSAVIGSVAGVGIGIYKRQPPIRWFTSAGINCAIATCCFCGFQELTRELRAADPNDWANCVLGGLASGALLGRIHGGPSKALPTGIMFATVGTAIQVASVHLAEYRLRRFLANVDQDMDNTSSTRIVPDVIGSVAKTKAWLDFDLPEWFPIKKFDEEEAKKRAFEKELQHRRRLESLHKGTFPVEDHCD